MSYYYGFAAKGIQSFLQGTDRLRDLVGGSELVQNLCTTVVDTLRKQLWPNEADRPNVVVTAAGWARLIFQKTEDAEQFALWFPLVAGRYAPGLAVTQAFVEVVRNDWPGTIRSLEDRLRERRNAAVVNLPEAGPLVARNPRNGRPVVTRTPGDKDEWIDRQTVRKRDFAGSTSLVDRFGGAEHGERWPLDMADIAGRDQSYIAIIHADANSLGQTVMNLVDGRTTDAPELLGRFSRLVEAVTQEAASAALDQVLRDDGRSPSTSTTLPARPIVLGGDDLTIIVRADLALDFAAEFLELFESKSKHALKEMSGEVGNDVALPAVLTAAAGIAITKKAYPFSRGYALAESLCGHAKYVAKERKQDGFPVASCLAFHRVTTSLAPDYADVRECELTSRGESRTRLTMSPYGVGEHAEGLPAFGGLKNLAASLKKLPTGPFRRLMSTLHDGSDAAIQGALERIREVSQDSDATGGAFVGFVREVAKLTGNVLFADGTPKQTPLLDAHVVANLGKEG